MRGRQARPSRARRTAGQRARGRHPPATRRGSRCRHPHYRAQLASLDDKENRIVDLFAAGSIEADLFKRQQARVREERDALFDKLQAAETEADDAYLVTADRVLELAKNAKRLWEGRTPGEQRDFLTKLVRNPV